MLNLLKIYEINNILRRVLSIFRSKEVILFYIILFQFKMKNILTTFLLLTFYNIAFTQNQTFNILSEKERATVVDDILEDRLDNLLPKLMEREGIDMWIIISREYNEDPVMKTILPSKWLSARRRTIMVFNKNKTTGELDKIAIARYSVGKLLQGEWNVDVYPDQWEA